MNIFMVAWDLFWKLISTFERFDDVTGSKQKITPTPLLASSHLIFLMSQLVAPHHLPLLL
jgi:hypothetical protein